MAVNYSSCTRILSFLSKKLVVFVRVFLQHVKCKGNDQRGCFMICFLLACTEPIIYNCMHEMSAAESYLVGTKCSPFAWCHCHGIESTAS